MAITVIGNYLSPYVRKVLVCLDLKGLDYEIDPIIPFFGNDDFTRLNPVRRIPILLDGDLVIPESAVICEYLDESYAGPALLPAGAPRRAQARALQSFADGRIGDVLIWNLFNQYIIRRHVWSETADESRIAEALQRDIPQILDYLETRLPDDGFLFGECGVADIAIASMFRNAALVRYAIDAARWPRSASFVSRVLDLPAFARLRPFEKIMLSTPIPDHRDALRAAGAPVTEETFATSQPTRSQFGI
jgi:glutathione S-transferase